MPPSSKNGNLNIVTSDSPQSELYELYEPQYFLYPSVLSSHANSPANSPSPLLEQSSASSVSSSSISSRSSFSISSRDSLSPHTVKSCKHCSFSFYRTDQTEEYCSKGVNCRIWYELSKDIFPIRGKTLFHYLIILSNFDLNFSTSASCIIILY
jgi:hypothetical protein